ncbi:MAG: ABC transporter permease [Actinomycetota bacterium]
MEAIGDFFSYVTTWDNWWGNRGLLQRTLDHLRLSAFSVLVAAVLALPAAIYLGHIRRGGLVAVWIVNIGRALPSFAVLALVLPVSLSWGFGLGFWPTAVALVLLALPPIFTNTFTGIVEVDRGTVEAAVAMGMKPAQVATKVEVPSALPLIITGLRVSSVQVVATATLGALVGFGGLGAFIIEGFAQQDDGKLLAGAVFVAVLSVLTEIAFGVIQRRLTPWDAGQPDDAPLEAYVSPGEDPTPDELEAEITPTGTPASPT